MNFFTMTLRKIFGLGALLLTGIPILHAQSTTPATAPAPMTATVPVPAQPLDKSPLDICYFPADYPVLKIQDKATEPLVARVIYSRPQKNGRQLFGGLIGYGKVWRLGANEATEIEFFKDVKIDGKKVKKGRYTLYALVDPSTWSLILNRETDTWGAFKYDQSKDVLRISVPVEKAPEPAEAFSMSFQKAAKGAVLQIGWDDVVVKFPFSW